MDKFFTLEQWRLLFVSVCSPILAFYTPTKGFVFALLIMFAFNIWCGMRADGVSIKRCKNFSFGKFKNALVELFLYVLINQTIYSVMVMAGDKEESLIVVKTLTYIFMYVYLQNAFKNLILAYPTNKAYRIIYHVIRLEFKRAMPTHVQEVINRVDRETDHKEKEL